ncbi:Hyaluronan synthase 3 [Apophysomyces ossiformis]|uniref:Hyaluronan synthase 3 n=1 Tax=Apophysomyces ossiformis TaxID=679940 RepID=A0A8H7BMF8_9FUNG|nr:Hyaluronan synthase 3 [Apophysomyces ossiformis]
MLCTKPVKLLYSVAISGVFVIPALVGYGMRLHISSKSFWAFGVYGMVVLLFIVFQLLFATLNRISLGRFRKKSLPAISRQEYQAGRPGRIATAVGLAVVGYREEPELFRQCLDSIRRLEYPETFKTVVVIDGNEAEDRDMAAIFEKIFPGEDVVVLSHVISEAPQLPVPTCTSSSEKKDNKMGMTLCYMQPHRGKRHAMYTAFRVLIEAGCEAIMTTDSDTIFDSRAMLELEQALHWHDHIGAVAGDVRIWNSTESMLAFMSSLRYWMAFNIERAAQSFNRCVTCVSGPMGMYRADVLAKVLDDWISQRFFRMECTYGTLQTKS